MYNRSAEPRDYTRVIEALPDKLDIKRHSPGILYLQCHLHREGPVVSGKSLHLSQLIPDLCQYSDFAVGDPLSHSKNIANKIGDKFSP